MQDIDMEMLIYLIAGPGLFVLGAFFVMLPFVAVRILGVALIAFTAMSGNLSRPEFGWEIYVAFTVLTAAALAGGAYLGLRLTEGRIQHLLQEHDKEHDAQVEQQRKRLLVPYAKDGTWFHPGLAYADGRYRVGQGSDERAVANYQHALHLLREMPVATWRRPSPRTGMFGLVSATHWAAPPGKPGRRQMTRPAA